jgi:hypothetical protein
MVGVEDNGDHRQRGAPCGWSIALYADKENGFLELRGALSEQTRNQFWLVDPLREKGEPLSQHSDREYREERMRIDFFEISTSVSNPFRLYVTLVLTNSAAEQ